MKAAVNGASGYIGFHLVDALLQKGHEVYAICRKSTGHLTVLPNSEKLKIIISEQDDVRGKLNGISPDIWYQLAWEGSCGEKRTEPTIQLQNELLYVNAMETAKKLGCRKIIYTGTVYENIADHILSAASFDKNSFYILAKKHAHEMTFQLSKKLGIEYVWCTFCHPVGKYMNPNQLIPYAVKKFVSSEPTEFGSCSQYFDIISTEYLAAAMTVLGENSCRRNNYYIGSGEPRILKDYLTEAASVCGYKLDIGFGKRPDDKMVFRKEWFDDRCFFNEFTMADPYSFKAIIEKLSEDHK